LNDEIIAIAGKIPHWVQTALDDYLKRFSGHLCLKLLKPYRSKEKERVRREEGKAILASLPERAFMIALDEKGVLLNTHQLASHLQQWQRQVGMPLVFIVGGTEGLCPNVLAKASFTLSLSPLTLPHALAQIVLVEQLYRARCILSGHPYHRA
jgi:23S rRNA (pseudouridine1915-N3)-methyltransferase